MGKVKFPHLVGREEGDCVGAAVAHRPSLTPSSSSHNPTLPWHLSLWWQSWADVMNGDW